VKRPDDLGGVLGRRGDARAPVGEWTLTSPHHDGSGLYVPGRPGGLGEEAVVRLRVPHGFEVGSVALRYVRDGEPAFVAAEVDQRSPRETWWVARFPTLNPSTRYRWLLRGGSYGYAWVNGLGVWRRDVSDADDFVITHDQGGPDWHLRSVIYEILPDRFASSGLDVTAPEWAVPRPWDALPAGRGPQTPYELFGGDLRGLEQHLDHVQQLGANALYIRPFFPAQSTHRYDAVSFDRVDPLLGGNEAFSSLVRAARLRGLRLIGDLTTNHTGDGHDWFRSERDFYFFDDALPLGYEAWYGVPSLPKLDWRSLDLRKRFAEILQRWLGEGLDGWRIDVANMTGRFRDQDLHLEVGQFIRAAVGDALLIAEHGHDFRTDLPGRGWHGVMSIAGFMRPLWAWLRAETLPAELEESFHGVPTGVPRLDGRDVVATMDTFRAGVPWPQAAHSWSLLDSFDSARFRTVTGDRDRQLVGVGLQMTMPGVPLICAGDELGLEGRWAEDGRRPMPWDRPHGWDTLTHDAYRQLIAMRRSSDALQHGGLRYVHVDADVIAFLRETPAERILCLASRGRSEPVRLSLTQLGADALETIRGEEPTTHGDTALLAADGPSFHAWKLIDG
jgi:alpha-glucosidase